MAKQFDPDLQGVDRESVHPSLPLTRFIKPFQRIKIGIDQVLGFEQVTEYSIYVTIKKQYKELARSVYPDKNSSAAA